MAVQSCPGPRFPQLPAVHIAGDAHCMLLVQAVMHVSPSQVDGAHDSATPAMQAPSPSHRPGGMNLSRPSQAPSLQTVPAAYLAHPPCPLQTPL